MDEYIREGERVDDLHRGGYRILQKPEAFCFGMDAVLLADFAAVRPGEKVLDLCTGGGIVPILMAARHPNAYYEGLEIQQDMAEMAMRSVCMNALEDRIRIQKGDLRRVTAYYPAAGMDVVTVNPPYMKAPAGLKNESASRTVARHEVLCTLDEVAEAAAAMLKFHGRLYMVHRPRRLPQLMESLRKVKLEPKRLRMVHPYLDKEPNLVLIEAVREGGEELKCLPPLIVYREPGQYTEEIYRIYGYEHES